MAGPDITPIETASSIDEQAALWIAVLDDGGVSHDKRIQFEEWYSSNAKHASAFDRLAKLYGHFDLLADLNDIAVSPIVDKALSELQSNQTWPNGLKWGGGIAAVFAIAASLFVLSIKDDSIHDSPVYQATVATLADEQKTIDLVDGSNVVFNTRTKADISYSRTSRDVSLKSGEAFFEVAPNANAPFKVITPFGAVQAVGTAFSVSVEGGGSRVLVTEGRVSVTLMGQAIEGGQKFLNAGQSAFFSDAISIDPDRGLQDIESDLDWRDGVLSFKGESLEAVINRVSQYTDLQIIIVDEGLKDQPIGGYFKIGETDNLFNALEIMAQIQVNQVSDRRVELSRSLDGSN